MPASITVSHLAWSTPDGRPVLSNLDLSFGSERTGLVGRNGVGKSTLLRLIAGDLSPQAGEVSIAGTLGMLRQASRPIRAKRWPTCSAPPRRWLCCDAPNAATPMPTSSHTPTGPSRRAWRRPSTGSACRPGQTLLSTLSGGQRTRMGLAALVFDEPDFILLDEPTNNLDRDGRRAVIDLWRGWRGGAIVVSHDRELLETLDAIVELTGLGATRYGGNFSHYRERKALELAAAQHDLADADRARADLAGARRPWPSARPARTARAQEAREGRYPAHPAEHAQEPQRGHQRQQCPTGRTPPRAGDRRCRVRPRAYRGPAAADGGRAVDGIAGRQDGPQDRCGQRRPRRSAGDPISPSPLPVPSASPSPARTARARRPCSRSSPVACRRGRARCA